MDMLAIKELALPHPAQPALPGCLLRRWAQFGRAIVRGWQTIELQKKQLIDFVSKAWHDNKDQSFDEMGIR